MKICSNAEELRNALNEIQPSKVAVAFVGNGWKKYIDSEQLEEIILSPTLGSNPKAIEEIMNTIGADNVYFLDNLHAKIYLGTESALLGSCNLSDNGFSDNGNFEAGIVFSAPNNFKKLESIFENYKAEAKHKYPTAKSKKSQLKNLYKQWQNSISQKTIPLTLNDNPLIGDYASKLDRIHITWWDRSLEKEDFNIDAISTVVPEARNLSYFLDFNTFCEEDLVQKGDWVLQWHCKREGDGVQIHSNRCSITWLYIHHVIPHGVKDDGDHYTKIAGQAENLSCPPPPFELNSITKRLIREALGRDEFQPLCRWKWNPAEADAVVPKFLEYLRNV
jgi:hypothetical protein